MSDRTDIDDAEPASAVAADDDLRVEGALAGPADDAPLRPEGADAVSATDDSGGGGGDSRTPAEEEQEEAADAGGGSGMPAAAVAAGAAIATVADADDDGEKDTAGGDPPSAVSPAPECAGEGAEGRDDAAAAADGVRNDGDDADHERATHDEKSLAAAAVPPVELNDAAALAPDEPARRTVEVDAFCSWSA